MLLISKGFISKTDDMKILNIFSISYLMIPQITDLRVEKAYYVGIEDL